MLPSSRLRHMRPSKPGTPLQQQLASTPEKGHHMPRACLAIARSRRWWLAMPALFWSL